MIFFRLTDNADPEERLEEAALWKAMHDEYGDDISILPAEGPFSGPCFGRGRRTGESHNPVSDHLAYWDDPAFLRHTQRRFSVVNFDGLSKAVSALHADGFGVFVKSTKSKHAIFRVPLGVQLDDVLGAMAYSFMDGGPALMVQQLIEPAYERRFFCIGREIVTESAINPRLTPIDFPLNDHPAPISAALKEVAINIARGMRTPHASIDCALIEGIPGVIELNPMILGNLGLYACDVRALARASRHLIGDAKSFGSWPR